MKTLLTAELVEKDGIRGLQLKSDQSSAPVAAEIEQLIQFLGRERAVTEPQNLTTEPTPGGQILLQPDVMWKLMPSADESLLLAVRLQALGWMALQFSAESEAVLLNLLLQRKERPILSGPAH